MSKTPYELRYDLLAMAQTIITENLMNERMRLEHDWQVMREMSMDMKKVPPLFPTMPVIDPDAVIAMAEKLNSFVSKDS